MAGETRFLPTKEQYEGMAKEPALEAGRAAHREEFVKRTESHRQCVPKSSHDKYCANVAGAQMSGSSGVHIHSILSPQDEANTIYTDIK